jgi:uncharacterized membrane protein YqjE
MANQTTLDDSDRMSTAEVNGSPPKRVAVNVSELASDVLRLMELQAAMLKVDLLENYRKLLRGILLIIAGLTLALGSIPVLLGALAALLHESLNLGVAASTAIAAACGLLLAIGAAYIGWTTARRSQPLTRSIREFQKNMAWLKQVITGGAARSAEHSQGHD